MSTTIINGLDFGPLAALIGRWEGDKGMDVAPDSELGREENPYFETILIEATGDVTNAETQKLAVVNYRQTVTRKSTQKVFHDQIGYWTWDAATGEITHSLTIPRAMCLLAGGKAHVEGDTTHFEVQAKLGDADWGVVQSPFLRDKASTKAFKMNLRVQGNQMHYRELTTLEIYGKTFAHTDENTLQRV